LSNPVFGPSLETLYAVALNSDMLPVLKRIGQDVMKIIIRPDDGGSKDL
jgi:hypothetical protein